MERRGAGRRRAGAVLVAAGLCAAGGGCGSLADRWHDAVEVLDVSLTRGPGLLVSARATELVQAGVGAYDGRAAGLLDGRMADVREQRGELGASLLHAYEFRRDGAGRLLDVRHPHWGDPGYQDFPLSVYQLSDRRFFDAGLTLHVGWFGVNAAFHPDQLVDFLTGLAGLDLLQDDAFGRSRDDLLRQARSLDARRRAAAFDALLRRGEPTHGYGIYTNPEVRPRFQREALEKLSGTKG